MEGLSPPAPPSGRSLLKEAVRAKHTRQTSHPDIEKIKKDLRGEVEEEFRKKFRPRRKLEIRLEKVNAKFYFDVTRDVTTERYYHAQPCVMRYRKRQKPWSGVLSGCFVT